MREYLELREEKSSYYTGVVLKHVLFASMASDTAHQRARQPFIFAAREQVARQGIHLLQTLFQIVGIDMHELEIRSVIGLAVHATHSTSSISCIAITALFNSHAVQREARTCYEAHPLRSSQLACAKHNLKLSE